MIKFYVTAIMLMAAIALRSQNPIYVFDTLWTIEQYKIAPGDTTYFPPESYVWKEGEYRGRGIFTMLQGGKIQRSGRLFPVGFSIAHRDAKIVIPFRYTDNSWALQEKPIRWIVAENRWVNLQMLILNKKAGQD